MTRLRSSRRFTRDDAAFLIFIVAIVITTICGITALVSNASHVQSLRETIRARDAKIMNLENRTGELRKHIQAQDSQITDLGEDNTMTKLQLEETRALVNQLKTRIGGN